MPKFNRDRLIKLREKFPDLPITLVYWKDNLSENSLDELNLFASQNDIRLMDVYELKSAIPVEDPYYEHQQYMVGEAIKELEAWRDNRMGNPAIASDILRYSPSFLNKNFYYADLDTPLKVEEKILAACQTSIPCIIDACFDKKSGISWNNAFVFVNSEIHKKAALEYIQKIMTNSFTIQSSSPEIIALNNKNLSNLQYRQEFYGSCYSPSALKIDLQQKIHAQRNNNQIYDSRFIIDLTTKYVFTVIEKLMKLGDDNWEKKMTEIHAGTAKGDISWSSHIRLASFLIDCPDKNRELVQKDIDIMTTLWTKCNENNHKECPQLSTLKMSIVEKISDFLYDKAWSDLEPDADVLEMFLLSSYKYTSQGTISWLDYLGDLPFNIKADLGLQKYYVGIATPSESDNLIIKSLAELTKQAIEMVEIQIQQLKQLDPNLCTREALNLCQSNPGILKLANYLIQKSFKFENLDNSPLSWTSNKTEVKRIEDISVNLFYHWTKRAPLQLESQRYLEKQSFLEISKIYSENRDALLPDSVNKQFRTI